MQVTDEMVRVAVKAYDAAVPEDNGVSTLGMEAALTAALAAMWRPISEAPDSETVIVGGGDAVYPVTASWGGQFDEGEGWQVDGQEDIHCEIGWPTHFMPLPSPPKAEG
ncbi:MAG: hypothetical protein WBH00_03995 [Xanthobacteraceae bacterium]